MPFASPEMLRRRLQFALWSWAFTLVLVVSSWALSMWINRACEFVRITETDPDDGSAVVFGRGIQQGQLLPRDACMGWGKYEYLTLDSRMKTARAASALSVVSGPIVMVLLTVYLFLGRPWMSRSCKWLASFLALANAIFQVLTHLMATSGLCQGVGTTASSTASSTGTTYTVVDASEADDSSAPTVSTTCDTNTQTYRATYYTIVAWAVVAVVVAVAFPVQHVAEGSKDNDGEYYEDDGGDRDVNTGIDDMEGEDLENLQRSEA